MDKQPSRIGYIKNPLVKGPPFMDIVEIKTSSCNNHWIIIHKNWVFYVKQVALFIRCHDCIKDEMNKIKDVFHHK